jgi:AP-4 complex subunit epsilon-1
LKQIIDHKLPKTYDYHKAPAPFLQIKLLKVLGVLGANDKKASEEMYQILMEVLNVAETQTTIGNAVVYECVKTATSIYPLPQLLEMSAAVVARFLKAKGHNLRYAGLSALAAVVRISPKYAADHQMAVIDCLEDPDEVRVLFDDLMRTQMIDKFEIPIFSTPSRL